MLDFNRHTRWDEILNQLRRELNSITDEERQWLKQRIALIESVQEQIHSLFLDAGGSETCRTCSGSCCEHGHNHISLINVVAALMRNQVPGVDFSATCPFLTPRGCSMGVSLRPFNCITFICEHIETHMNAAQVEEFYRLEKLLRTHYVAVDERYAGSSLRGLFIGTSRLGARQLLQRRNI